MSIFFVKVQFLKAFISQKACGLDCILMVIPMNCDPDVSYILVELFNTCLKECFSTDCQKVSYLVHLYQNDEKRFTAKNHYHPASLLSLDSKIFEKLPYNRLVNHIKKCGLFSKFQYGFRYSQSTTGLLPYFRFSR